jgi:mannose-6-phosphate isomerase-like protein (cupin superfamily)
VEVEVINIEEKFSKFHELWAPKIIAQMNDYHFKIAKVQGDFIWHEHNQTDEVFLILRGDLRIDLPNGSVELHPGEMCVVPKGLSHKPSADTECYLLLVEPSGTVNTGDTRNQYTVESDVWI